MATPRLTAAKKAIATAAGSATSTASLTQLSIRLSGCSLRFHLKLGMTPAAANEAIDDAFDKFAQCLQRKLRS